MQVLYDVLFQGEGRHPGEARGGLLVTYHERSIHFADARVRRVHLVALLLPAQHTEEQLPLQVF